MNENNQNGQFEGGSHYYEEKPAGERREYTEIERMPEGGGDYSGPGRRYIKKLITRVIAISIVLSLLIGGGVGIILNEYVFSPESQNAGVSDTDNSADNDASDDDTSINGDGSSGQDDKKLPGNILYTNSNNVSKMSVADVVAEVEDSVVAITVEIDNTGNFMYQNYNYTQEAKGSGVIISADGYIVTNNHVIENATRLYVTLSNGESHDAVIVGSDAFTDIGLIKIEAEGLTVAKFGENDSLRKGDETIIIGNPLGYLDGSVSYGIISALGRTLNFSDGSTLYNLIQTDAAVNPGNSGGGLFDAYGALIGIVCAKTSSTEVEGLGFAIPISTVKTIIQDLKDFGYIKGRPALGITAMTVNDPYTAMYNKLPRLGVYVTGYINSEAEESTELEIGDCIVSINGTEVTTTNEILALLYPLKVGDTVEIVVYRNNEMKTVKSTLVEQDDSY